MRISQSKKSNPAMAQESSHKDDNDMQTHGISYLISNIEKL